MCCLEMVLELMISGGRKALLNLDRGELFKGTTPQVLCLSATDSPCNCVYS